MNRVVLGTAQLGLPYGATAGSDVPSVDSAEEVLEHAWAIGVRSFDTAEAYGCAAERLAAWLRRGGRLAEAHVVTKIQRGETATLATRARDALTRFDGAAQRTLLAHGAVHGSDWERLAEAAHAAGAEAGQSVYDDAEVRCAVAEPQLDRLQAPGNIFDDRARMARGSAAVRLDSRSVFLQGILLLADAEAERRVAGAGALARAVMDAAAEAGQPSGALLVAVMLRHLRAGDRLVLGADSPRQLEAITRGVALDATSGATVAAFERQVLARVQPPPAAEVLDPRRWVRENLSPR